jgi:hypothetical protein
MKTDLGREAAALLRDLRAMRTRLPAIRLLDEGWGGPRGRIYLIKLMLEGKEFDSPHSRPPFPSTHSKGIHWPPPCSFISIVV